MAVSKFAMLCAWIKRPEHRIAGWVCAGLILIAMVIFHFLADAAGHWHSPGHVSADENQAADPGHSEHIETREIRGQLRQQTSISESRIYKVKVQPEKNIIPMHDLHAWHVEITNLQTGKELQPAMLDFTGGMEAHGHGLPTAPQVSDFRSGMGSRVEGVRFNMTGVWFLQIEFRDRGLIDRAIFEVEFVNSKNGSVQAFASDPGKADPDVGDSGVEDEQTPLEWSDSERQLMQSLVLQPEKLILNNSGNEHVENPAAAHLGHRLFFDPRLSADETFSCASCHQPENYFTDNEVLGNGREQLTRNTLSVVGASTHRWLYWDGRRDSAWSQALVPLEAAAEMGNNRLAVVSLVERYYHQEYTALFGPLPSLPALNELPEGANPLGNDRERVAWNKIPANIRYDINTVFSNIGKAIAAYEAKLLPAPGDFDRFVQALLAGDTNQADSWLGRREQEGLKLFISARSQCLNCHSTPIMSNRGFHNIGTGLGVTGEFDFGRMMGGQVVLMNEFNCRSRFSDDEDQSCQELQHINKHEIAGVMRGAFRVPTLRGLSATAPYMHDGRFATLDEVVEYYVNPPVHVATGMNELPPLDNFTDTEKRALVAFLQSLGDEISADERWLNPPAKGKN